MKRTIALTVVILLVSAGILMFLSGRLTESWQQPVEDEVNITINPPVEDLLGDKFKEYKYRHITADDITPDSDFIAMENLTQHKDGMLTPAQAAAYGGMAMDKIYPEVDWSNIEVEIYLVNVTEEITVYLGVCHADTVNEKSKRLSDDGYVVDPYTGEVLGAQFRNPKFNTADPETASAGLNEEIWDSVVSRAKDIAQELGYSVTDKFETSSNMTLSNYYGLSVVLHTDKGEDLGFLFYNNEKEDYPLQYYLKTSYLE